MRELTQGEQRFINESTMAWLMYVNAVRFCLQSVPDVVTGRIDALDEAYREQFWEFFRTRVAEDGETDTSVLQAAFEEKWLPEHPAFLDLEMLFEGCDEADLEMVRRYIKETGPE